RSRQELRSDQEDYRHQIHPSKGTGHIRGGTSTTTGFQTVETTLRTRKPAPDRSFREMAENRAASLPPECSSKDTDRHCTPICQPAPMILVLSYSSARR